MGNLDKYLKIMVFVLLFVLAGSLFWHNLLSINLDVGRHLKLGEIIWETKSVPDTNLFSYTEPDHSFINHHWLSEVILYGVTKVGGLKALILVKTIVLTAMLVILVWTARKRSWVVLALSFVVSLVLLFMRTEPRPEIFSYFLLAVFLTIIYRSRESTNNSGLWLLPFFQLFWVNLHIYFFVGLAVYGFFLLERLVNRQLTRKELVVGLLMGLTALANPSGWRGALYPLLILEDYAYGVMENEPISALLRYGLSQALIFYFFIISAMAAGSFIGGHYKMWRKKIFDGLLLAFLIYLAFRMQRNVALYAVGIFPLLALNFPSGSKKEGAVLRWLARLAGVGMILVLMAGIGAIKTNRLYAQIDSSRRFGWGVSLAAEEGVKFVKDNQLQGFVFNNFEIGSFLIWKLYPSQKVFVDGRPEAYSEEFFNNILKPMLSDQAQWERQSKAYQINYIFFNHNNLSDNAQEFLRRINKDAGWRLVFLNETVVIYVKNNSSNRRVVADHGINKNNIWPSMEKIMERFNTQDDLEFRPLASALFFLEWPEAAAGVYERLKVNLPADPYAYQGAGLAYATIKDLTVQKKATQNLEEAIRLGLGSASNYFTLGVVYANLRQNEKARQALKKVLEINPNHTQAKNILKLI